MCARLLDRVRHLARTALDAVRGQLLRWTRPAATGSLVLGAAADLVRTRSELIAENALLRQQLIVLARASTRPRLSRADRPLLVLLASRVQTWRQALLIVRPETLLRWHREGFRLFWRWRSGARRRPARVAPDTVALIRRMARENRLWGAERIQGDLLKLGIRISKRTVQKYMHRARPPRRSGQSWATFLRTHGRGI